MNARVMTPWVATRNAAIKMTGAETDYDALLQMCAGRDLVLLGEASHGTLEFYRMRAEITRRLIEEQGFEAVAAEADWPDAYRLNRFVRGIGAADATRAFDTFERFPQWMWRNREVYEFVRWLQRHNASTSADSQAGFYGLDLYSMYRSADAVIAFLRTVDPEQAEVAKRRYACLDHVRDPQQYGYEATFRLRPDCRAAAIRQLADLYRCGQRGPANECDATVSDEQFVAERNAAVVLNAERYYRAMFGARVDSWNLRDLHMNETLFALQHHLRERGGSGRIVVWAHNSHLGDARATDMGRSGEWNLGQLVRQQVQDRALLVGFTTYTGFVSAAHEWDGDVERMAVRPALDGSVERLFQQTRLDRFFLPLVGDAAKPLQAAMLERAIGVIYRPDTERASHYFQTSVSRQFDAVFHIDETEAVEPLDEVPTWTTEPDLDGPETYPFGI